MIHDMNSIRNTFKFKSVFSRVPLAPVFLVIFAALVVVSCADQGTYSLKGTALGYADGTQFVLFELDTDNKSIPKDTLGF